MAAAGASPLKLLLDEMLPHEIAVQLRQRGWDVESTQGDHTDLMGVGDTLVLERWTAMGRALVAAWRTVSAASRGFS